MQRAAVAVGVILAAVLAGWGAWYGLISPAIVGPPQPLTIGTAPLESSALIYVAEREGLFNANRIHLTIREYATGAAALNGLVNGEVDIAVPAEYALVGKAFNKAPIRAIASIAKSDYFFLVGRKDRGIERISDLKGKKVGVVQNTIAEFYLGRLLDLHGLAPGSITPVNMDYSQSERVLLDGELDAIISRPPYVMAVQNQLNANANVWPAQSSQPLYAILVANSRWIAEQPERVRRLQTALAQAEEFIIRNPAQAQAIVQKWLNLDNAYVRAVWSQNQFDLSLDQSLIVAMEDEARWMIKNNLTAEKQMPNFLDYIYLDGLKAVKPEAVNVIR
ncbi:MAG: NrtA/SsuA/CpmA family ABC transporter substrate-binding protein [Chloroflexi bacterium]|nr:NrtA/SsuA/CpmA family ABC transporter substrate-binding protein [Chloroflexota bacterium]